MENKVFFINSNIFLDNNVSFYNLDDILTPVAGNVGNSYITYSLIKKLGCPVKNIRHIQNIYTYDFSKQDADIEIINSECDTVFLILQDQIRIAESYGLRLPFKNIIEFIKRLNKPVVIAGLGANSFNGFDPEFHTKLSGELIDFLKFLSDNCLQIGVRGNFTAEVLHNIGVDNVKVLGCPSFFEAGPDRVLTKNDKFPRILLSQSFENPQVRYADIMCQDFQERGVLEANLFNKFAWDLTFEQLDWMRRHKFNFFVDINQWKNCVSKYDITVGNRVHGSILSINSGVPAICINKDSRAREMCELMKIPYHPEFDENTDLIEVYRNLDLTELNSNYPKLYQNYENFLTQNNVEFCNNPQSPDIPAVNLPENYDYDKTLNVMQQNVLFAEVKKLSQKSDCVNMELQSLDGKINDINHAIKQKSKMTQFLRRIVSFTNSDNHKVVCLLGLKFKFKRR